MNGERAIAVAKEMASTSPSSRKDMQAPDIQAALQENVGLGDKLGLSGTRPFIVGDEIIPGAVGVEPIRKTVAGVRQCGHATC